MTAVSRDVHSVRLTSASAEPGLAVRPSADSVGAQNNAALAPPPDAPAAATVALGYVRHLSPDPRAPLDVIADRLSDTARRMGFGVTAVYRDPADANHSGFRALMAHVRSVSGSAVLMPSAAHLSRDPDERCWMKHMLNIAGATLVIVPETGEALAGNTTRHHGEGPAT